MYGKVISVVLIPLCIKIHIPVCLDNVKLFRFMYLDLIQNFALETFFTVCSECQLPCFVKEGAFFGFCL